MKSLKTIGLILTVIMLMFSCKNKEQDEMFDPNSVLDSIPENKYYESDIFQNENTEIYGVWRNVSRTQEGINGPVSLSIDFDFLVVKPNAIFGIIRNEELITSGKIELVDDQNINLVNFICESDKSEVNVQMLLYNNLRIELNMAGESEIFLSGETLRISYGNEEAVLSKNN
jgi:hypothetical protein